MDKLITGPLPMTKKGIEKELKKRSMDANMKFEIKAEAFRRMTGLLAPGKDAMQGPPLEERMRAWDMWLVKNGKVVDAMLRAMERVTA